MQLRAIDLLLRDLDMQLREVDLQLRGSQMHVFDEYGDTRVFLGASQKLCVKVILTLVTYWIHMEILDQ
jgi:hypothetical protein